MFSGLTVKLHIDHKDTANWLIAFKKSYESIDLLDIYVNRPSVIKAALRFEDKTWYFYTDINKVFQGTLNIKKTLDEILFFTWMRIYGLNISSFTWNDFSTFFRGLTRTTRLRF